MLLTFVQVSAAMFTLISSLFLIKGSIGLSLNDMVELSLTKWGYNKEVLKNLAYNFINTKIGFIFILVGFIFQTITLLWPYTIDDVGGFDKAGVILALCFSFLSVMIAVILARKLKWEIFEKAEKKLEERMQR